MIGTYEEFEADSVTNATFGGASNELITNLNTVTIFQSNLLRIPGGCVVKKLVISPTSRMVGSVTVVAKLRNSPRLYAFKSLTKSNWADSSFPLLPFAYHTGADVVLGIPIGKEDFLDFVVSGATGAVGFKAYMEFTSYS